MNLLVVPKPLFNEDMAVEGYFLAYQYGNAILESVKSNPFDRAMNSPFIDFMNEVGLESLTQNNTIFLPVSQILLFTDMEREIKVDGEKVAFMIEKNIDPNPALLERIHRFVDLGFKFGIRYEGDVAPIKPFLPLVDYIFMKLPPDQLDSHYKTLRREYPKAKLVATDIEAKPIFDKIKYSGIDLFDGPFYKVHIPTTAKQNALSPLKVNYIQLLNIVNQDDFDFQAFTKIVRQDTALAIQFMRLVNASSRSGKSIKNLNQAAAMLGQREIKKWVSTAVSNALCADRPSEITRISLLRAKFCENMAKYFEMAISQENLFLLGLFSVLDVVLELPIEEALAMVFVPEPIHIALVDNKGDFYEVLDFVLQYEHGNWQEISRVSLMKHFSIEEVYLAYKDALLWYSELINMPEQPEEL